MFNVFFALAVITFIAIGILAEYIGENRGKAKIEGRAMMLLEKLQELLEEEKAKKALKTVRRFTSGEANIEDIIADFAYPLEDL